MTAAALIADLRRRGLRLRMESSALQVAPRKALTDSDRVAIREHLAELKALVQAEADLVATAAELEIRACSSHSQDAEPDDDVCHPLPNTALAAVTDTALDTTLFRLAERAGFPRLVLSPAVAVRAGESDWRRFAANHTSASLRAGALAALRGREPGAEG
jgi:hypothetical protein